MAFLRSLLFLVSLTPYLAQAQCPDLPQCDALGPQHFNLDCGVDPNDASLVGIYALVCPCAIGEVYALNLGFTGTDGSATTLTSSTTLAFSSSESAITFDFPEQNTAIQSGSQVTIQYILDGQSYPQISFTSSPVTSIYYTEETDTVTVTVPTATESTSIITTTTTTA